MESGTSSYITLLRKNGLKATPKRKAVIALMQEQQNFMSPQEVWEHLLIQFPSMGLTSVYRILEKLELAGIVTRVQRDDRQLYYYLCAVCDRHHHHFICTNCHGVQEVQQCQVDSMYQYLEQELGCQAESHFLQIEGLCAECKVGS